MFLRCGHLLLLAHDYSTLVKTLSTRKYIYRDTVCPRVRTSTLCPYSTTFSAQNESVW